MDGGAGEGAVLQVRSTLSTRLLIPALCLVQLGCSSPEPAAPAAQDPGEPSVHDPVPSPSAEIVPPKALEPGPAYVNLGAEAIEDPASVGIGAAIPGFEFTDVRGERGSLAALLKGARGLVVVFSTLGCPVCKNYHPSLERLAKEVEAQGLRFLVVDPSIQDTGAKLRGKADRLGWSFRITQDPVYQISDALSAMRTTVTYVIDAQGVMRYHGALDDQYGINYRLDAPRNPYLRDAIAAVLAGSRVSIPATTAPGCRLSRVVLPPD